MPDLGNEWNARNNPYWSKGGRENDARAWAFQGLYQSLGRSPNTDEIAQALPAYMGTDPHRTDVASGDAWATQYKLQQNAPTAQDLWQKQQQASQQQYTGNADKWNGQVNALFQQHLGRAASQDELSHFGTLLATNQTDPYELTNYLKQTPEYTNAQDTQFRQQLSGQLNDVNSQFFKQYIQPSVIGQFASQGRDVSGASTGLQFALANAAKEMQMNTQQYMAGLGAQQYGGRQEQARQDYEAQMGQQYGRQNASFGNQISNQNNLLGQGWASANYGRQSNDLMNYMNNQRRAGPNPWISAFGGALQGAAAGGARGGLPGAVAGGVGGGLFGGLGTAYGGQ